MDERIDIEVQDKVAKSIRPTILGIADAADIAAPKIAALKREMNGFSAMAQFRQMAAMSTANARAVDTLSASQLKSGLAHEKLAQAQAKTALAQQKVATETAKTALVEARATVIKQRLERQAEKTAAALNKEANATAAAARAATNQQRFTNFMTDGGARRPFVSGKSARDSASVFMDHKPVDEFENSIGKLGKTGELTRQHMLNLGFQIQDIIVSLQAGQNPLTVFIQQGGQIGQIAAQSGVGLGGMARALGGILLRFAPLAIAMGTVVGAFALFNREVNKDVGLKRYTKEMGFTYKEVQRLNSISVSFGDTFKAIFQVGLQRITSMFGISTARIKSAWSSMLDFLTGALRGAVATIYAQFTAVGYSIARVVNNIKAGKAENPLRTLVEGYREAYGDAQRFMNDVGKQAAKNARARQDELANQLRNTPKGKEDKTAEKRADALAKINRELQSELRLLGMVGPAREIESRFLDISNNLADKKIKLTQAEAVAIRNLLTEIESQKLVQTELNNLYETVEGPINRYEAALEASNRMLAEYQKTGKDTADIEHLIAIYQAKATEEYRRATNPLYDYNKAMRDRIDLLKFYGKELETQTEIQRRYNEMVEADPSLKGKLKKEDLRGEVEKDARSTDIQGFLGDLEKKSDERTGRNVGGNEWIIKNYQDLYAQIDQLRQGDVESEQRAAEMKKQLNMAYFDARIASTEKALNYLSALQNSKSKEMQAIGKAAAIAQATIDAYRAINSVLADPTLPVLLKIPLAAVIGAGALANVASIAGVGFEKGGYTGDMGTKQAAGIVHGKEFVFDAVATRRIGVANLEAMRRGGSSRAANDNVGSRRPIIRVQQHPGVAIEERSIGEDEVEIIARRVVQRDAPAIIGRDLRNPNSQSSKGISRNYKVRRDRS